MKDDGWNDTGLHYAAANGNLGTVEVLLAYGAAFYLKNSIGEICMILPVPVDPFLCCMAPKRPPPTLPAFTPTHPFFTPCRLGCPRHCRGQAPHLHRGILGGH